MARAIWSGSISFGLVNVPVKLVMAVKDKDIHFHLLSPDGQCRLRRKLVCPETGQEFDFQDTARGYEVGPDQYVLIDEAELDQLKPEAGRMIEIKDFVSAAEIDPIYYDRSYYLIPEERGARAYRLLLDAITRSQRVAIAKFVMRSKEYLAAIRPVTGLLGLNTMHYADEIVSAEELGTHIPETELDKREIGAAEKLIDALTTKFKPESYHDEYRERVMEYIERKAAGEEVVTQPPSEERPSRIINLMEALEKSVVQARGGRAAPARRPARRSARTPIRARKRSA